MIVLDTDHVSLLQRPGSQEGRYLLGRLARSTDPIIVTTVMTIEEQMRGWLQVIARYRELRQKLVYYDKLIEFVQFFGKWRILPLEETSVRIFEQLQQARVRISTTDMKIAAITMANEALLLSRNSRDFKQVPGLPVEDWTKPE